MPLLAGALALVVAACGGSDDSGSGSGGKPGNGADLAFIDAMVAHHESAIAMARIAKRRGTHQQLTQLADDIVVSQDHEIGQMRDSKEPLIVAGVKKGALGTPGSTGGIGTDAAMLKHAKPFDREFIDVMVSHHQRAIRLARVELDQGRNADLKRIAQAIVDGQAEEIEQMNAWRTNWYGSPSKAGGVPAQDS
jgi:uncharacterized protein (DUF305 family)